MVSTSTRRLPRVTLPYVEPLPVSLSRNECEAGQQGGL